jgi:alpha-1,6-mannosyltransferase
VGIHPADPRVRGDGPALKLLDITEFYSPLGGGVRTYLHAKAAWLARHGGVRHAIVVPAEHDATDSLFASTVYRIAGPPAPASPGYHLLLKPRTLRGIIEREQPDVIELGSPYLAPWLLRYAAGETGARWVGFFHMDMRGVFLRQLPGGTPDFMRTTADRLLAAYLRSAYRRCDRVVAASGTAERALHDIGITNTALVPLGVDTELFHPSRRDPAWRRSVGATDQDRIGLYVGRLSAERGLRVVIQALPELHGALGLRLVVIGEGHLRPELEAFATRHPDMLTLRRYETDRERLATAYASADVLFAPFGNETFGLAALEAAASGLPVVGAGAGALHDLLRDTEWSRTFRPGDAPSLAAATGSLLEGEQAGRVHAARRAAEGLDWERTFSGLLEVYTQALQR